MSHHMISHDRSYDRHGKVVHRLCSSCISSVGNLIGTLLSSCQMLIKEQLALFSGVGYSNIRTQYLLLEHYLPWTLLTLTLI